MDKTLNLNLKQEYEINISNDLKGFAYLSAARAIYLPPFSQNKS